MLSGGARARRAEGNRANPSSHAAGLVGKKCSDGSHSNYNGAAVTGVEKRAAAWLVELRDKAVRLDERVFGVLQPALGPFQRRLQEIGGIAPLVFGQYGELSASFETLIDTWQ